MCPGGLASGVVLPGLLFYFFFPLCFAPTDHLKTGKASLTPERNSVLQRARLGALPEIRVYLEQIWLKQMVLEADLILQSERLT